MTSMQGLSGILRTATLNRFIPEPKSKLGSTFGDVLNRAASLIGGSASSFVGIDPGYQDLLIKQIEVQQQMQLVSMTSNIEKSKHETRMAAVRNVRTQ